jgi:hypothetical protein
MLGNVSKMKLFCDTYLHIAANQYLRQPLLKYMLESINKLKKTYEKWPDKLIMLYICTLHLDKELSTDFKKWK